MEPIKIEAMYQEHFDEIDIEELIGAYTKLSWDYSEDHVMRGDCPLCKDTKGDLWVDVQNEIFNCMSCGEFGNAVHFLARLEQLTIADAEWAIEQRLKMPPDLRGFT